MVFWSLFLTDVCSSSASPRIDVGRWELWSTHCTSPGTSLFLSSYYQANLADTHIPHMYIMAVTPPCAYTQTRIRLYVLRLRRGIIVLPPILYITLIYNHFTLCFVEETVCYAGSVTSMSAGISHGLIRVR